MKQETLEEVAYKFSEQFLNNGDNSEFEAQAALLGVQFGAKWQQERMYSEEEVLEIIDSLFKQYASSFRMDAKEYFLLFKKK